MAMRRPPVIPFDTEAEAIRRANATPYGLSGPDDDLPIFDDAQPRSVDFAPRALRARGGRGPLVARAWIVGLAALVSVGVLAGGPASDPGEVAGIDEEALTGAESPEAPSPPARAALVITDVVDLGSPAPARVEVTTQQVHIAGSVLVHAARVEISLEARGNRVIDRASVDVSDPDSGVRPLLSPTFTASFDLPYPRPNGTMWVVVTVYDERGMPLGGTRRPFAVGPLLEPEPVSDQAVVDGEA